MLPLLTLAADFAASSPAGSPTPPPSPSRFTDSCTPDLPAPSFSDFLAPTFRTMVFGLIIGVIACFQGMRTAGRHRRRRPLGHERLVLSSLFVMLADVILVKLILVFFPMIPSAPATIAAGKQARRKTPTPISRETGHRKACRRSTKPIPAQPWSSRVCTNASARKKS